jgi:hypothetical protein
MATPVVSVRWKVECFLLELPIAGVPHKCHLEDSQTFPLKVTSNGVEVVPRSPQMVLARPRSPEPHLKGPTNDFVQVIEGFVVNDPCIWQDGKKESGVPSLTRRQARFHRQYQDPFVVPNVGIITKQFHGNRIVTCVAVVDGVVHIMCQVFVAAPEPLNAINTVFAKQCQVHTLRTLPPNTSQYFMWEMPWRFHNLL